MNLSSEDRSSRPLIVPGPRSDSNRRPGEAVRVDGASAPDLSFEAEWCDEPEEGEE